MTLPCSHTLPCFHAPTTLSRRLSGGTNTPGAATMSSCHLPLASDDNPPPQLFSPIRRRGRCHATPCLRPPRIRPPAHTTDRLSVLDVEIPRRIIALVPTAASDITSLAQSKSSAQSPNVAAVAYRPVKLTCLDRTPHPFATTTAKRKK